MTDVYDIAAKSCYFDNVYYRSELEREWALFFKKENLAFQYEPMMNCCDKSFYTPDFLIKHDLWASNGRYEDGIYIEIKPAFKQLEAKLSKYIHVAEKELRWIRLREPMFFNPNLTFKRPPIFKRIPFVVIVGNPNEYIYCEFEEDVNSPNRVIMNSYSGINLYFLNGEIFTPSKSKQQLLF